MSEVVRRDLPAVHRAAAGAREVPGECARAVGSSCSAAAASGARHDVVPECLGLRRQRRGPTGRRPSLVPSLTWRPCYPLQTEPSIWDTLFSF